MAAVMSGAPARADGATTVPDAFLADPLGYFAPGRENDAIRFAGMVAADPAVAPGARKNALLAAGAIQLAHGRIDLARAAFHQILDADPTAAIDQPDRLPRSARNLYYRIRDTLCVAGMESLVKAGKLGPSITTVAVYDFRNGSAMSYGYDLDKFARGLVGIVSSDLMRATSLKVVDREHLAVLRDEIGMSQEANAVDRETRVRFGRLSGAQSYVFGTVMMVKKDRMRIALDWIETETSDRLPSNYVEGSVKNPQDMLDLERRLVELLAKQIEDYLARAGQPTPLRPQLEQYFEQKAHALPKNYTAAIQRVGEAIALEDAGDFATAAVRWGGIARDMPGDPVAAARARALANSEKMRGN